MKHKFISLLLIFISFTLLLSAQSFEEQRKTLVGLMQKITTLPDSAKPRVMADFATAFETTLRQKGAMDFPFDSIPYIEKVVSPDKKVRIFTWCLPIDSTYHYYGILQYRIGKNEQTLVLTDKKKILPQPETAVLQNGDWVGAIYYDILQNKTGGQTYYTLLGFDFNSPETHCKLLDVLVIKKDGTLAFGAPLFDNGKRRLNRVLLAYDAKVSFFLNYVPRKKMIVYQHLDIAYDPLTGAPVRVPAEIFDGLVFKSGRWQLQENVEVRPSDFK